MKLFEVMFLVESDDLFVNKVLTLPQAKLKLESNSILLSNEKPGSARYEQLVNSRIPLLKIADPTAYKKALKTANGAYEYAKHTIKGRWPEGEPVIATEAIWAFYYAKETIKGRWPAGEPVILTNATYAYTYTYEILHGRWPKAEPIILTDVECTYYYALNVIKKRWPMGEPIILTNSDYTYYYAKNVIKGRWVKAEKVLTGEYRALYMRFAYPD